MVKAMPVSGSLGDMLQVGSVLIDFDGTACTRDVGVALLEVFGDPS